MNEPWGIQRERADIYTTSYTEVLTNILLYPRDSDLFTVGLDLSQNKNKGCKYIKADIPLDTKRGMQEWWKLHSEYTLSFRANHTPNICLPHYIT
jgi:hypothetical protein